VSTPRLSVVIPAFNEARRLPRTLESVCSYLRQRGETHEILVVDDGSSDETAAVARQTGGDAVTVVSNERNRGKGYSVRRGMLLARGERRLMTDADLSTPIEELERLLQPMNEGYGVAIASRAMRESRIEVHQPWYRENMGRLFNLVVRVLAVPGLHDTQCGFKLFSARAAFDAFADARLDGFGFDVESLFLARKRGHRIAEVPVTWRNDSATRVTLLGGFDAFLDVVRVRANHVAGRYRRRS
jgi:dolichyl-phosphate beta-glucosyltransferase